MGRAERHPLRLNSSLPLQSPNYLIPDTRWHARIIHRDKDGRTFLVAADGQRFGPKPLLGAFRLRLADGVTGEADGVIGRDVDARGAYLERAVSRARNSGREDQSEKEDKLERSTEHIAIVGEPISLSSLRQF